MNTKIKFILILSLTIIPVFVVNVSFNLNDTPNYTPKGVFGLYLSLLATSMALLLLLNKFFLKKDIKEYNHPRKNILTDISSAFLLLAIFYICQSLSILIFGRIFELEVDNTHIITFLEGVYANPFHLSLLFGPFAILQQAFWALSLVFTLQNLWSFSKEKWHYPILFVCAAILAFSYASNNIQSLTWGFLIYTASAILYYKYRRILPFLIAFLLFLYFDLISILYYFNSA